MVKFLIIRFSSIGDIVLTSPVVRSLKQQVEGAEVHYLTKKKFAPILENNPYIDHVHTIEKHTGEVLKKLQKIGFHHIIDLHKNIRSNTVKSKLRTSTLSFNKLNIEKWLLVNFKWNNMPDEHIVDRYMKPLQVFDVSNDNLGLDFFIPEETKNPLTDLPETFNNGYVAFSLGANHATKRMPPEKVIKLIEKIDLPVILLGGNDISNEAALIRKVFPEKVFDATGKYSLNQSALFLKDSKYVITYDTGLMHIAAAFKKNILSIWGNTVPEFGMTPYLSGSQSKIFEIELPCRPCSKIGFSKCPKKHFKCMMNQDLEAIAERGNNLSVFEP